MAAENNLWRNTKTQRTSASQKQQHIMILQQQKYSNAITAQLDKTL